MQALLLLGLAHYAASGVIHPIPNPFRWDESFTVEMPQLDDEHRGLFNAILKMAAENNAASLKEAGIKFTDHFNLEQDFFRQTMSTAYTNTHTNSHNSFLARFAKWAAPVPSSELAWGKNWLVQHIKNTDHQYIGVLPHHVPTPFHWDDSVEVFYNSMDSEHKGLFDAIRAVGDNLLSTQDLSMLKTKVRAHFDHESGLYCVFALTHSECEDHNRKHNVFFKALYAVQVPVAMDTVKWAENWLVQHIKNTDFQYKHKLSTYRHTIPSPYAWEPSFKVFDLQLDNEHSGLFDGIRDVVESPNDAAKYEVLKQRMTAHFAFEQSEFMKIPDFDDWAADHVAKHDSVVRLLGENSVPLDCDFLKFVENWLVQHIKNTDFAYRGKIVHSLPNPFVWDESFITFYEKLDDQHKGLFDCVREAVANPSSVDKFNFCKTKLRMHFDYEESEFCKVPDYDCYGHYLKHYNFQTKFQSSSLPLTADVAAFAMNWLVQHIKNTDFAYRGKLPTRGHYVIPDPFVWDETFLTNIQKMDDEHTGLFDMLREVAANPGSQATWNRAVKLYSAHFSSEEDLFTTIQDGALDIADHRLRHLGLMNTLAGAIVPITEEITEFIKNWLTQHIKNSDFKYKGKMPKIHAIPDPFRWTSYFAVFYEEMDDQHKVLFSCLAEVENNKGDSGLVTSCMKNYEDHFAREEHLMAESGTYPKEELYQHRSKHNTFLAVMRGLSLPLNQKFIDFAKNWLSQHIANTDARYKGKMPFHVSDPFAWDESFEVFHTRLDKEHGMLFAGLQLMKDNPNDVDILNNNRDVFRDHFDHEEKQFMVCGEGCGADDHKKKHDMIFKTLTWVTNPVSADYVDFAMNWLTQHIKNTDFQYRYKLKTSHKVPAPFVWNSEFLVSYPKLDDEHKGLFAALYAVEMDLNSQDALNVLAKRIRDHFYYEETQFCDALNVPVGYCLEHTGKHTKFSETLAKLAAPVGMAEVQWAKNWLVQHIKNTDFGYKGGLKHEVPEPFKWDASFKTDYSRMDSEHNVLFASIQAVAQQPGDAGTLAALKNKIEAHFQFEEQRFCAIPNFNCIDHRVKHYNFWVLLEAAEVPINCAQLNFAKNWLTQHIKNTDHQYRKRMVGPDSGADFSGAI